MVDGSEKHWLNLAHFGWSWGTGFQCKKISIDYSASSANHSIPPFTDAGRYSYLHTYIAVYCIPETGQAALMNLWCIGYSYANAKIARARARARVYICIL